MGQVDTRIASALRNGMKASGNNTTCDGREVWLHGSVIASVDHAGNIGVTLAGWNTSTTRARVNAILQAFGVPFSVKARAGNPWLWTNRESLTGHNAQIDAGAWLWFAHDTGLPLTHD